MGTVSAVRDRVADEVGTGIFQATQRAVELANRSLHPDSPPRGLQSLLARFPRALFRLLASRALRALRVNIASISRCVKKMRRKGITRQKFLVAVLSKISISKVSRKTPSTPVGEIRELICICLVILREIFAETLSTRDRASLAFFVMCCACRILRLREGGCIWPDIVLLVIGCLESANHNCNRLIYRHNVSRYRVFRVEGTREEAVELLSRYVYFVKSIVAPRFERADFLKIEFCAHYSLLLEFVSDFPDRVNWEDLRDASRRVLQERHRSLMYCVRMCEEDLSELQFLTSSQEAFDLIRHAAVVQFLSRRFVECAKTVLIWFEVMGDRGRQTGHMRDPVHAEIDEIRHKFADWDPEYAILNRLLERLNLERYFFHFVANRLSDAISWSDLSFIRDDHERTSVFRELRELGRTSHRLRQTVAAAATAGVTAAAAWFIVKRSE